MLPAKSKLFKSSTRTTSKTSTSELTPSNALIRPNSSIRSHNSYRRTRSSQFQTSKPSSDSLYFENSQELAKNSQDKESIRKRTGVKSEKTRIIHHSSPLLWSPSFVANDISSLTSRDKRDIGRDLHASFSRGPGLSWEEITCDEVDDLLPKTDYTYVRSASYSPLSPSETYTSPNMSRRRLRRSPPAFLSDNEEEYSMTRKRLNVSVTRNSTYHEQKIQAHHESTGEDQWKLGSMTAEVRTSTPLNSQNQLLFTSGHDQYSNGVLLRSGHHLKGPGAYFSKQRLARSDRVELDTEQARHSLAAAAASSTRAGSDFSSHHHNTNQAANVISSRTTTTTTTSHLDLGGSRGHHYQKGSTWIEDAEKKLRLDETQTEKDLKSKEYKLNHLYGLDYEEEFSDTEGKDAKLVFDSRYRQRSRREASFWFTITTIMTSFISTLSSRVSDGSKSVFGLKTFNDWLTFPGRWLVRGLQETTHWLFTQAATFLLWDIDVKQRRRRGCVCCLLPFLLLLPLLLLGGYYTKKLSDGLSTHIPDTSQLWSLPWWYQSVSSSEQDEIVEIHQQSNSIPAAFSQQRTDHMEFGSEPQVDMAKIYQYIELSVTKAAARAARDSRTDIPAGLTIDQVETVVKSLLSSELHRVMMGLEEKVSSMKSLLQTDLTKLRHKILELESDIGETKIIHKALTDSVNEAKGSIESATEQQAALWLAASKALEEKLLNLTREVQGLSSQNAAFTAVMANCCRNSSALVDIVRAEVFSVLSRMATDDNSLLFSLMSSRSGDSISRTELDQGLTTISQEIMASVKLLIAKLKDTSEVSEEFKGPLLGNINETTVKLIVDEALAEYSADRLGMPDFALESAGGSVVSIRCSETYYKKTALISVFGIPLWYTSNSPRTIIQPNVNPGECWAFKGQSGYIVLQLSHPIVPSGFTLEHIPRSLAPRGDISSAPKTFAVFGLSSEKDLNGISLGNYTYLDSGKAIQFFSIQNQAHTIFQLIELRILDNYGNKEYTCLYRFRVHGQPVDSKEQ